jgi:hypothetical protein
VRVLKVTHVGKFYPPVPGGMERVVESLCAVTRGRLESRVLAFNTSSRTVAEVSMGSPAPGPSFGLSSLWFSLVMQTRKPVRTTRSNKAQQEARLSSARPVEAAIMPTAVP